jgi:type I restriction enzyme S subunit
MREMKNSGLPWIGIIPDHWECIRGKYILKYLSKPVKEDDGVITCFRDGEVTLRSNRREDGFTMADKEIGYQGIDIGDLVVHGMDGFAGAIGISDSRGKASPVLNVLDTQQNKRYIMYYLRSMAYGDVFIAMATGIRVRSCDLRWNKLANFEYLVPPIEEQIKIAEFLDAKCSEIDALLADIQAQIETLEQYKRSTIAEAVTKGLDSKVELKDSTLEWTGKVPVHWEIKPNKYLMKKLKQIQPIYDGEDIISLTVNGVIKRDLDNPSGKMPTSFDGYQFVYPGNLLMCLFDIDVTPRCIGLIKDFGLTSPAYSQFVLNKGVDAGYYYYYYLNLDFNKELLHLAKNQRHSLNEEQFGAIKTVVPPFEEQVAIAKYLDERCDEINKCISAKQEQIATLESYKKSIIFEYVTGKKEVE